MLAYVFTYQSFALSVLGLYAVLLVGVIAYSALETIFRRIF